MEKGNDMRHIPSILLCLIILIVAYWFTWTELAHKSNDTPITKSLYSYIEKIYQQKNIPLKNSGLLFGKNIKAGLKQLFNKKQIIEIKKSEEFLKIDTSLTTIGWMIEKSRAKKIYWIIDKNIVFFYCSKDKYKIDKKSVLSLKELKIIKHQENNYFWITVLIIIEFIIIICLLRYAEREIFGREQW